MATPIEHDVRHQRAAKSQDLFRHVNERVNEINRASELWLTLAEWVCECAEDTCIERIELTPEEYERVRENPAHFAVVASDEHVIPEVERVVEKQPRYWVVEKVGQAAAVVTDLDPRA